MLEKLRIIFKTLFILLFYFGYASAQNTNITINSNLNLNCKFEKVILKNPDHNFETFSKDEVNRNDITKLFIESKIPNVLNVRNLSNFIDKIELEVKISNRDIVLIQAFDQERNYSESAVLTIKTGELIHEITKNIKLEEKEKDISFYSCKKINQNT